MLNPRIYKNGLETLQWRMLRDSLASKGAAGLKQPFDVNVTNQRSVRPSDSKVKALETTLNNKTIRHIFGYGSGVLPQASYENSNPQVDVIIVTDDPREFHSRNIKKFRDHYSALRLFGANLIAWVQETGAGVYFNPYVPIRDVAGRESMVKYGIISAKTALEDVCEWSSMYIAGRLQKPVFHQKEDPVLLEANQFNLGSAFNVALLALHNPLKKNVCSLRELFITISSLSYMGDIRMIIGGENPNKVANIVSKQEREFLSLYEPFIINAIADRYIDFIDHDKFEIKLDESSKVEIIRKLPLQFRRRFYEQYGIDSLEDRDLLNTAQSLIHLQPIAKDQDLSKKISDAIRLTIRGPALSQTIKGVITAGPWKAGKYAWEKREKAGIRK